jgi:hypothetical protein
MNFVTWECGGGLTSIVDRQIFTQSRIPHFLTGSGFSPKSCVAQFGLMNQMRSKYRGDPETAS